MVKVRLLSALCPTGCRGIPGAEGPSGLGEPSRPGRIATVLHRRWPGACLQQAVTGQCFCWVIKRSSWTARAGWVYQMMASLWCHASLAAGGFDSREPFVQTTEDAAQIPQ